MEKYIDLDSAASIARVGKNFDRNVAALVGALTSDAALKVRDIYSIEFVEAAMPCSILDIKAHHVLLILRSVHGWKNGRLSGRLQLIPVGSAGELGNPLLEISVSEHAITFEDRLSFSAPQLNATTEHEFIAVQTALRVLAAVQSTLPNFED